MAESCCCETNVTSGNYPAGSLNSAKIPQAAWRARSPRRSPWTISTGPILDAWQYHIRDGVDVLIVTYGCHTSTDTPPVVSNEHKEVGLFTASEAATLRMPDGYKKSIAAWYSQTNARRACPLTGDRCLP